MAENVQYQIVRSDGAIWTVTEGGRLSIGRSQQNDVQITDSGVSRRHATLIVARGRCWIRDEDSTRGTYVNGQPVPGQQEFKPGDELRIGPEVFRLERTSAAIKLEGKPPLRRRQQAVWAIASTTVIIIVTAIVLSIGGSEPGEEIGSVQTARTNASGMVVFRDPATGEDVSVTVLDTSGTPLDSMTVAYEHGETYQYEAFFVQDEQDQLVAADFFLHNSDHEIVVEPNVMHRANPDQERALAGYVSEMGKRSQDFYQDTLTCEEYEAIIERAEIVLHIEVHIVLIFFGVHGVPLPGTLEYEGGEEPCEGQWDWYESYSPAYYGTEIVYIQSQPPVVETVEVEQVEDGRIQVSWLASDPTEYSGRRGYKIDSLDHTIFLEPTAFSDVTYHYRLLNRDGSSYTDWNETGRTEVELDGLEDGTYTLEVYATDEVDNHSETTCRVFTVGEGTEEQPVGTEEDGGAGVISVDDLLSGVDEGFDGLIVKNGTGGVVVLNIVGPYSSQGVRLPPDSAMEHLFGVPPGRYELEFEGCGGKNTTIIVDVPDEGAATVELDCSDF
jgi:pSer/pThr/pTyr-binding forkhead associated (FHA) protein